MKPPILPGIRFSSLNALKITGFTQGSSVSEVLPPGFLPTPYSVVCCSVAQLYPTLHPHGLQRARLPCPAPFSGVPSNSCPLSSWCHPTISSYATHFSSCPHPFPASGWRKWEKNHRAATSDPVLHPDKALRAQRGAEAMDHFHWPSRFHTLGTFPLMYLDGQDAVFTFFFLQHPPGGCYPHVTSDPE